ncbi:phosphoribosylformylglycinamidine cyclo-ligase [Acutalibacter muris]|uniref:phosphoribosylformylglycinamidine cyclo-ligase n=1 Tax=Acutalibacter muris TaxID=1796620 RepID=UPI002729FDBB|nr:phosphoribosylformylglycinamidine cyclo-ligase [Acutalibacter muris]
MESNLTKPQESHLKSHSASYAAAGVDVTAGYESVELMKKHVARTAIPGVVSGIGGFGGLFRPELAGMEEPILVSGTDGVGTKLKIAMLLDKHDTIGIDAVAMCVNDIVCCGARPLFFLDYIACGKNYPEKIAEIVSGVAEGCVQAGCALIGGETAEHPGMMPLDDYDIAGFTVGVVDRPKMIDGSRLAPGDVLIGVKSSGVHSNGFSLVRKVFGIGRMEDSGESLVGAAMGLAVSVAKMLKNDTEIVNRHYDELGCTLGEALLTPTRIYVKSALAAIESAEVKAISHITGGGFYENIPRMLTPGLTAKIEKAAVPVLPIFNLIQKAGDIPEHDMFNTFNMGVGLCMAVSPETADKALEALKGSGEDAVLLGEVVSGDEGVLLW